MVIRERKRLRARLKRNKKHVMVMFVCMNAVKTYYIECMDARAQQRICLSVIWKSFWDSKNMTMKTSNIVLWFLKNSNNMMRIQNIAVRFLRTPCTSLSIMPV